MRKPIVLTTCSGDGRGDSPSAVAPTSVPSERQLELDQLVAVAELCAISRNLTRDQEDEVRSLAAWLQGWQVQEPNGLAPTVLQFIRACACECLEKPHGVAAIAMSSRIVSVRIH